MNITTIWSYSKKTIWSYSKQCSFECV